MCMMYICCVHAVCLLYILFSVCECVCVCADIYIYNLSSSLSLFSFAMYLFPSIFFFSASAENAIRRLLTTLRCGSAAARHDATRCSFFPLRHFSSYFSFFSFLFFVTPPSILFDRMKEKRGKRLKRKKKREN